MISQTSSPRQFRASVGPNKWRKPRKRKRARPKRQEEPGEAKLLESPRPKAVAPYTPGSELEDYQLRFLIHYYVTIVSAETLTNVGPRFEWYPLAVRDEAFFHSVISSTCAHVYYTSKVEVPYQWMFLRHKIRAIQLVNERLSQGAHDEGTINSIAVFAQQESFEARPKPAEIHLKGLLQIVQAAGGLDSQELSEKTRRHIYLTELAACIALEAKPRLPPRVDLSDLKSYFGEPSSATFSYAKNFGTRLFNYTGSPLSDQAATVFWGLRNISELLEKIREGKVNPDPTSPSEIHFTDRVEVLERMVHPLWYVEDAACPQHAIFRSFGSTCLIYIYSTLRELPKELGMNVELASRIKIALDTSGDLNVLLATFQDLLIWEMFICGRIAHEREKSFFVQQATKILMVRKLEDANQILAAADTFLWPEREPDFDSPAVDAFLTSSDAVDIEDERAI